MEKRERRERRENVEEREGRWEIKWKREAMER